MVRPVIPLCRLVGLAALCLARSASAQASRTLIVRQTQTSESGLAFLTATASSSTSSAQTEAPTISTSPSTESHEFLMTKTLEVAPKPLPLAATIGLIMPNPYEKAYVEIQYNLGFVEVVPRPAPTIGGWLRVVTPLLLFPDHNVNVLPDSGTADPVASLAIPPASGGLCGAVAENYPISYPYIFHRPGWYMFVINQTWSQPTITNSTCALPLVSQQSFFATYAVSLSPLPTGGSMPRPPTSAYTLWAGVTTSLPGPVPLEEHIVGAGEKLGLGLGVTGGVLAFVAGIGGFMYVRSRKKAKRETEAFNRLKPNDQAQFLADNPEHFLNPYRRAGKTGVDGWGRPIAGWRGWGRWGQGSGVAGWGGQPGTMGWNHGRGGNTQPGVGGGIPPMTQAGYGWGQQPYGGEVGDMRQVYNVLPQQSGGPGLVGMGGGIQDQRQPLMVWPTGAPQGGYGYR